MSPFLKCVGRALFDHGDVKIGPLGSPPPQRLTAWDVRIFRVLVAGAMRESVVGRSVMALSMSDGDGGASCK